MKLVVEHQGRAEEVFVERREEHWLVRVGDTEHRVDAAAVSGTARSLRIDGGQYEVDVAHLGQGRYEVVSNQRLRLLQPVVDRIEEAVDVAGFAQELKGCH